MDPAAEVNVYSARKEVLIRPLLGAVTAETGIACEPASNIGPPPFCLMLVFSSIGYPGDVDRGTDCEGSTGP